MKLSRTWELTIERTAFYDPDDCGVRKMLGAAVESFCEVQLSIREVCRPLTDEEWADIIEWATKWPECPGRPQKITFVCETTKEYDFGTSNESTQLRIWNR